LPAHHFCHLRLPPPFDLQQAFQILGWFSI
jgi:hypothetical protein